MRRSHASAIEDSRRTTRPLMQREQDTSSRMSRAGILCKRWLADQSKHASEATFCKGRHGRLGTAEILRKGGVLQPEKHVTNEQYA